MPIADSSSSEAFDRDEWGLLRRVVEAGVAPDTPRFKSELLTYDQDFPRTGRSGAYLWFCLRYRASDTLQRVPSVADLSKLATDVFPRFRELVNSDLLILDRLLQVVFEYQPSTRETQGAGLIVNGAAALAAMLNSSSDLDAMEEPLARWYNKNGREFAALEPRKTRTMDRIRSRSLQSGRRRPHHL